MLATLPSRAAKAWLTFLVASRPNLTSRLWSSDNCEHVVSTFYDSKCQHPKSKGHVYRILCRFCFAWFLFVLQPLSPPWTATQNIFMLSMGFTATQSTGAKYLSLWLIYFEFLLRPYGFASWGVGSAGFGKKMMVASRPNSFYGGYSY